MADLSIFKLDNQSITIKDTTARQTAESAKALATTASDNATTALNKVNEQFTELKNDLNENVSDLKSALSDVADSLEKSLYGSDIYHSGLFRDYPLPDTSFNNIGVKIISDGRSFYTDYKPEAHKNIGGTTYYVSPTGDDSNDGLSPSTPKATIASIILADGDTVIMMDGKYDRYFFPSEINKSINIIAQNKHKAIVVNSDNNYAYTLYEGNVYHTSRSNVSTVLFTMPDGKYNIGLRVSSLNDCKTTAFSWYGSGSDFYINTGGLFVPNNNNTYLNLATNTILLSVVASESDVNLYLDGVILCGGNLGGLIAKCSANYDIAVHAVDCEFLQSFTSSSLGYDAVSILGGKGYFVRCMAGYSRKDGFNYHSYKGKLPYGFEYECEGCCNGINGLDKYTNNGSTIHDGGAIIRIGCVYHDNYGTNVADVSEGTTSLNLLCSAFNSHSNTDGYNCDFSAQNAGATMWLDGCVALKSTYNIFAVTGTTMHIHNCEYETTNGGGTIDTTWVPSITPY